MVTKDDPTVQTQRVPRTRLGRTGLEVSKVAIGTLGFGSFGPAATKVADNDEQIVALLNAIFAAGINVLDSADIYDNEARLGRLLKQADSPSDLIISTKFGHGLGFTADQFRRSAEKSLEALDIPTLPIMMVHDPRNDEDMKIVLGKGGALEGLRQLQDEGLVTHIGVATGTIGPLWRAIESDEFDAIQFPRLFTLLDPAARRTGLLEAAAAAGVGTFNAAPFGGNILATGAVAGAQYCYQPALPEVFDAAAKMGEVAEDLGVSLPSAALAYSLQEPHIDVTVLGVRTQSELELNLTALDLAVGREELEAIADAGQVDPALLGAPTYLLPWPAGRVL